MGLGQLIHSYIGLCPGGICVTLGSDYEGVAIKYSGSIKGCVMSSLVVCHYGILCLYNDMLL